MSFNFQSRLSMYAANGLGLNRGDLVLMPHNAHWKRIFSDEAYLIFDSIRDETLRLYHIGSTSVPGINAKPIIDILGSIASLEQLDQKQSHFEAIGYEYKGEYGIKGRRYCVLYSPEKDTAYIHLHIFEHGDPKITSHLNFRDQLRHYEQDRAEYQQVKTLLVEEHRVPRKMYSDAKQEIITKIQAKANQMAPVTRVLAILGSAPDHSNTHEFLKSKYNGLALELVDISSSSIQPFSYSGPQNDCFPEIIEKIIQADLTVIATPVYWYSMSGAMKDFWDRFSDLLTEPYKVLGESLYGKKFRLLSTGSDLRLPVGFETPFSALAIYFGMDYLGADYRSMRS